MDAPSLIWSIGQVLSVVALLIGAVLTLMPWQTLPDWLRTPRTSMAGRSDYSWPPACHATCSHRRYAECHPPCNHRLFLEAEW